MSLQDVEALGYAVITDMRGCAGDKAIHMFSVPAAERARERRPEQTTDARQRCSRSQVDHVGLLIHDSANQSITAAGNAPLLGIHP
jgi:hypothetical protein